jgi:DNA polymerase III epsilon subunit-like protein
MSPPPPRKITESLLLAIDVESTGLNTQTDSIVELGGAYVCGGALVGHTLRTRVNPGRYIPADATRVHGISNEDVEGSPPWRVVSEWLRRHVEREGAPIVCGYNILSYDAHIINSENERAGHEWRLSLERLLDPFIFCRWYHPELQSRLGSMCKAYGIELPEDRAHSADADSAVTAMLVVAMVWAGYIPDDVEEALATQARLKGRMEADEARYGRGLYVAREGGEPLRLMIARGTYRGKCVFELSPSYIQTVLNDWKSEEITDEARALIRERIQTQDELGF